MKRLVTFLLALLLLSGCGGRDETDWSAFAPAEEDRLVIYTSHSASVYDPIVKEFEERTGVWVQVETGGTGELLERLEAEKDEPRCDLLFGGGVDSLTARKELFAPYVSPLAEEIVPAFLCAGGSWTPFSVLPVVLLYNPVLVRTNPPDGWESLLDPVWKGRIAFADPTVSGSGYTALATMLQALPGGGILEAFCRNLDGQTLSGINEVMDVVAGAVAEGSCTVGVTVEPEALEAVRAGRDVALVYPKEGTSAAADGMAVVSGCAHEENARRFIDFALSVDVQRHLTLTCQRRSVRADLYVPPEETGGLALAGYDLERAAAEREQILSIWRSLEEGS
ncbi:MAG: extracellular solute-binding protein [Oscillospiraceae bacterium]|nr:extracellular solute-binding protein [Oscillospiraceae bacterium]